MKIFYILTLLLLTATGSSLFADTHTLPEQTLAQLSQNIQREQEELTQLRNEITLIRYKLKKREYVISNDSEKEDRMTVNHLYLSVWESIGELNPFIFIMEMCALPFISYPATKREKRRIKLTQEMTNLENTLKKSEELYLHKEAALYEALIEQKQLENSLRLAFATKNEKGINNGYVPSRSCTRFS